VPLSAGTRLGPYEIQSPLGAGGMGEVYRARDTRLDRTVAVKILPSADPELKARFEREARAIAALTHPHICTLYALRLEEVLKHASVLPGVPSPSSRSRPDRKAVPFRVHNLFAHAGTVGSLGSRRGRDAGVESSDWRA
jgi:serine/threonine protein kinase